MPEFVRQRQATSPHLDRMDKPQVDRIDGIPPAIAIDFVKD